MVFSVPPDLGGFLTWIGHFAEQTTAEYALAVGLWMVILTISGRVASYRTKKSEEEARTRHEAEIQSREKELALMEERKDTLTQHVSAGYERYINQLQRSLSSARKLLLRSVTRANKMQSWIEDLVHLDIKGVPDPPDFGDPVFIQDVLVLMDQEITNIEDQE